MKNSTLMKGLGIGLLGWVFLGSSKEEQKENYFRVKDGREVPESQMPAEGYVKYGGKWVLKSDLQIAAGTLGITDTTTINPTTPTGLRILNLLFGAGQTITASIINNTEKAKKDLITQIQLKYLVTHSPSYNANFPHTIAQLNTYTIKQLEEILKNGQ